MRNTTGAAKLVLSARAQDVQLRIADWITGFAGSMNFVYIHIVLFTVWMLLIEHKPWPTLTLIVSLEAIFLSTFVMIGQNRQAAFIGKLGLPPDGDDNRRVLAVIAFLRAPA